MSEEVAKFFQKEFDIDLVSEYERLKDIGKIPLGKIRDREVILNAVNEAGENAHRAKQIHLKARRMYELYQVEFDKKLLLLKKRAMIRLKE